MDINSIMRVNGFNKEGVTVNQAAGKLNESKDNCELDKKVYDVKKLEKSIDIANNVLFKNNTHLKFEIHEKTKDIMVKIVDDVTGDILKEIPPEKMLDMVAKLWEIAGIIVDEKR